MIGRPRSIRRVDPLGGQYGPLFIEREIGVTHHIDGMGERRLDATTCPDQTQMIPSVFLLDAQSLCPLYPRKRTSSRALVLTQFTISLASAEYFCDSGSDNVSRRLRIRPQLDTQLATGRMYFSGFGETKSTSLTRSNSCQTWLSQWRT
jgi:hypothetical protein